jgi:hypothetical protein
LENLGESDLRAPTTVELRAEAASGGSASVLFSFWPYLLLASLALLALEWFIFPRRPAPRLVPAGGRTTWRDGTARS